MYRATDKQLAFIGRLSDERVLGSIEEAMIERAPRYDKRQASALINMLLACPKKQPVFASATSVSPDRLDAEVEEGYYVEGKGETAQVFHVTWNRPHTRKYVLRLNTEPKAKRWEYLRDTDPSELAGLPKLSLLEAAKFGKRTGRCAVCGRTLSTNESMARGIGPVCAEKLG